MSSDPATIPDDPDPPRSPRSPREPVWKEFARAPLVPVALAVTAGLVADRSVGVPLEAGLAVAAVGLAGWGALIGRRSGAAVRCLWVSFAALAAVHHHAHRYSFTPDDIGNHVAAGPKLVRVRGVLAEDPVTRFAAADGLTPMAWAGRDETVLRATAVAGNGTWVPASGLARLTVDHERVPAPSPLPRPPLDGLRAGDAVEVVGMLSPPRTPSNPGERDAADRLLDQRVRAEVGVTAAPGAVVRVEPGRVSPVGLLGAVRRSASAALFDHLPRGEAGVAAALLLGDGSAMDREEWDAFIRTGVVHALAISGQHLVVIAGFLWVGMRVAGVRRSRGAWVVLVVVVGYAVLTGLRPSGVRAAAMVAAVCGGLILGRPATPANAFALGWLVVVALNPADPFALGCRLSFLSVFILVWGVGRWLAPDPPTPLEQLVEESRSGAERVVRAVARAVFAAYVITAAIWAVNVPLLVADQNIVSPVGLLVGPPVVVLTSVALVAGFLLMLLAPLGAVVAPFAVVTEWALAACGRLVRAADGVPGGSTYVAGVPAWWLAGFYAGVVALVLLDHTWRLRCVVALLAWVLVGLLLVPTAGPSDELRMTFLAVGKGGCTVIETPDGRCLVYDAGAAAGPAAVRRVVAPYLWHRGVRRVDELFLSHADADHFNGVGELLRRFPVGQVTLTPSFADKPTREVAAALLALERHGVPRRVAVAGDRFAAGDVEIEALHPPPSGPPGEENERSLVLHVRHAGHAVLLTGDLEKSGTGWVLDQKPRPADVLMAPHHGSRGAAPDRMVRWCGPRLVLVSRGPPLGNSMTAADAGGDVPVWDTHAAGAITLRSHRTGLTAEAFRTGERLVVARGGR